MRTKKSNALIVELPSRSALRNRNSLPPGVIPMSPNAVRHAVRQGSQIVTEIVAMVTGPNGKCFPQCVPSVAKTPKFRLSPAKVDQYIVAIATIRSD